MARTHDRPGGKASPATPTTATRPATTTATTSQAAAGVTMVVEDDPDYADVISYTLKRDSHNVVVFDTAAQAVAFAAKKKLKLAVLDILLPDATGLELCEMLRRVSPDVPILFVSSLDGSSDIVNGLQRGGDDYLTKPFHPSELLARTQALMRRARVSQAASDSAPKLANRGIEVDQSREKVFLDGRPLDCTPVEVAILSQLTQYPGQALSHGFLTQQVWGYSNVDDASLLKGHISSIRKKVRQAGGDENLIRTVHAVGYSYMPFEDGGPVQ